METERKYEKKGKPIVTDKVDRNTEVMRQVEQILSTLYPRMSELPKN